jgi:adenosine/AMP kinase
VKTEEVALSVPEGHQLILGQAHFIKTVEDIYETLVTSMPGIRFGVAFCEASGKALVRSDGTEEKLAEVAREFASRLAAGHSFVIILDGAFPINVLNRIKAVDEVAHVFCATSNPVVVVVADTGEGRGILGVVDGVKPKGLEGPADREERKAFLRKIGYKR